MARTWRDSDIRTVKLRAPTPKSLKKNCARDGKNIAFIASTDIRALQLRGWLVENGKKTKSPDELWAFLKPIYESWYHVRFRRRPTDDQIFWLWEQYRKFLKSIERHEESSSR